MHELACGCVRCSDCHGSGLVAVETGSYPEEELGTCETCRGSGISEVCEDCLDYYESDSEMELGNCKNYGPDTQR